MQRPDDTLRASQKTIKTTRSTRLRSDAIVQLVCKLCGPFPLRKTHLPALRHVLRLHCSTHLPTPCSILQDTETYVKISVSILQTECCCFCWVCMLAACLCLLIVASHALIRAMKQRVIHKINWQMRHAAKRCCWLLLPSCETPGGA